MDLCWSNDIRVKVDGVVYFTESGGRVIDIPDIPSGSNKVEVVCCGWSSGCITALYLKDTNPNTNSPANFSNKYTH